ncbi:hypothetical protein AVEN_57322-1 [Araneus ventricosus]|uniref:Uncharacterized protein n=1 Tax=Araneus ventricosus TaxID=182803 RepID=A0A4Y2INQ8_ARAVE|nr:hypothetical protein AVEN_57322-1 [Araneus ventricosus]
MMQRGLSWFRNRCFRDSRPDSNEGTAYKPISFSLDILEFDVLAFVWWKLGCLFWWHSRHLESISNKECQRNKNKPRASPRNRKMKRLSLIDVLVRNHTCNLFYREPSVRKHEPVTTNSFCTCAGSGRQNRFTTSTEVTSSVRIMYITRGQEEGAL